MKGDMMLGPDLFEAPAQRSRGRSRNSSPSKKKDKTEPYNRLFSTQYGGFSYKVTRPPAKSRYMDFEKVHHSQRTRKSLTHDAFTHMIEAGTRNNAMEFEAADDDMDNRLSFNEFKNLVRSRLSSCRERSEPQLMAWYKALDTDGDGSLSMAEFFAFSLREAFLRANTGKTMEEFFKHWDTGGNGKLNREEFTKLAERVGFGKVSDELIAAVDVDGSGIIEYSEFINMLRANTSAGMAHSFLVSAARADMPEKKVMPPMMLASRRASTEQRVMDMHGALQDELRSALVDNGTEVLDLFRAMDVNNDELLSAVELNQALNHLNLDVPPSAVQELYDEIDRTVVEDGQEQGLTLTELNTWMLKALDSKEVLQQQLRDKLRENAETVVAYFMRQDADKNAVISISRLNRAMTELGYQATEEAVGAIFDDLDSDGSGYVAMPELKKWLETTLDSKAQTMQTIRDGLRSNGAKLMRIFNSWDYDHNGTIDVDELGKAMKELGYEASREVLTKVFEELDRDRSNAITLQELNRYLLRKLHTKAQLHSQLKEGLRAHGQRVIDLFRTWDVDGDALITENEFSKGLTSLGFRVPPKVVKRLFDELDADANFRLSFSELNQWLRSGDADSTAPKKVEIEKPPITPTRKKPQSTSLAKSASAPPAPLASMPSSVFTRKNEKDLKTMDKSQRHALIIANLMKRYPEKTEGEVRHALHKAKWQPGGAALILDGHEPTSHMTTQPKSRQSRERGNAPAAAPAAAAKGEDDEDGEEDREEEGDPEVEDFLQPGRQTPASIADAKRRQKHKQMHRGLTGALTDLVD